MIFYTFTSASYGLLYTTVTVIMSRDELISVFRMTWVLGRIFATMLPRLSDIIP